MKVKLDFRNQIIVVDNIFKSATLPYPEYLFIEWDTIKLIGESQLTLDSVYIPTTQDIYNTYAYLVEQYFVIAPETPIPLETLKLLKFEEIKQARDTQETSGFSYLGKIFDSDQVSVSRMSIATLAALAAVQVQSPFSVVWTVQDNSTITLNASQMIQLPIALATFAETLHAKSSYLKSAGIAANTKEELDLIVW